MRIAGLLVLAALLLVASARGQEMPPMPDSYALVQTGDPTNLYFHLLNHANDVAINTQEPDPAWSADMSAGSGTSTATCLEPVLGNTLGAENEYHTYRGYASPNFVHYDVIENGVPRTHPERGIGYDVAFSNNAATLYWYLRAMPDVPGSPPGEVAVPTPVANVVVRATLRTGDAISVDDKAYDTGNILAQGETLPALLAGDTVVGPSGPGPHPQVHRVSSADGYLYEFAVPLEFQGIIPRATGYNVRIDVYSENPWCADPGGDGYVMPNVVVAASADGARPRLELQPAEPLRLEHLATQFVEDEIRFHVSIASPWGQYDVDHGNATVTIFGPSNATSLHLQSIHRHTEIYSFQTESIDLTYAWPYKADDAKAGSYTFVLNIPNLQGTAALEAAERFDVGGEAQKELPAPAFPFLILAVLAAVGLARRR